MRGRWMTVAVAFGVVALASGGAWSQEEATDAPVQNVAESYKVLAKPGHAQALEDALKAHIGIHADAGDDRGWDVWQQILGDEVGALYIRTCCYSWAEFDRELKIEGDREHIMTEIEPHIMSMSGTMTEWLIELSRWPDTEPPKMVELVMLEIDPLKAEQFFQAVATLHDVIAERDLPIEYAIGNMVLGSSGPDLAIAFPRDTWADFGASATSVWEIVQEVLGAERGRMMREMMVSAVVSESDVVLAHRPDLSYRPAE